MSAPAQVPKGMASRLAAPLAAQLAALPDPWRELLSAALDAPGTQDLLRFVDGRLSAGATVYPPAPLAALHAGTPAQVRVVILGQDPYHGAGQAHGLAFSVPDGVRPPPSLRNIFGELEREGLCKLPRSGNLQGWSRQGVLLLNCVLTVEEGTPGSHAGHGWETLSDAIVIALAALGTPRVFLLWGAHAQSRRAAIEGAAAASEIAPLVLVANHPSPLSARRPPVPFLGCGHFSQTNRYLADHGLAPINWRL